MEKKRILLVDDQKLILLGLERTLRRMRNVWEVDVAESGAAAREIFSSRPFDAVLADLNMPGYGGAELLDWVRERWPGTARIVLSGHQDKSMILGATRSAHRFLTKPCEPDQLLATLQEVLDIQDRNGLRPEARAAVSGTVQLPSSAVVFHKLRIWLETPGAPQDGLANLVRQDPGLSAMVLHLVDSGFFGTPRSATDPSEAVAFLDREQVACLLGAPVEAELEARLRPIRDFHLEAARRASAIVRAEGGPPPEQSLAYTAALLCAAGPMILAAGPFQVADAFQASRHYLDLLGLPGPLPEIAGCCLEPSCAGPSVPVLPLAAVHVALGHRDEGFLSRAGFLGRIEDWNSIAINDGE